MNRSTPLTRLAGCALALVPWTAIHATTAGPVLSTPQVSAELVAHAPQGIAAARPLQLGLKLEHKPGWHTYWKNPGDSGLPTTLAWSLPAGVSVGAIEWPTPRRLPIGPLVNYGYEGTLLLPVTVQVPAGYAAETLPVRLHAEWLVCKEVCIPEAGDFALDVPVRAATAGNAALFEAARAARAQPLAGAVATARVQDGALDVRVSGLPASWVGRTIAFFPETPGVLDNAAAPDARWHAGEWRARLVLDAQRSDGPATLPVVLAVDGQAAGVEVAVNVEGGWPPLPPVPGAGGQTTAATVPPTTAGPNVAPAVPPAGRGPTAGSAGLGVAMLLALAGGMLLNLMPCVFPVLSLKVLGFARHAAHRRTLIGGGLAYTAGVVASFVALAALLLALRAGGEQIGWGFQLQAPGFVAALAVLFTLIGLNLGGVFEFGSLLPSGWLGASARHPMADALLTGVLAVAVASPCTAPFMGAALGVAVTLSTANALAVFAALGLGMALPYLAASVWPGLAARLPRPGAWMAHFKALMAFPMFATVVWLVWVLGQQVGIDGAAALLGVLVAVAFAAWVLGSASLGPLARRGFGAAALLFVVVALAWAVPSWRHEAVARSAAAGERWQPWSPERVTQALAQGQPVFVDFTAAWCVTCQFNKRTTLARDEVLSAFGGKRVLLLRADWTRRDAAISAELARLARSGVPVYALYAPGAAAPSLLSEILSVEEIKRALASLPS
ncbi:MAG: thioredoxin family protein [Proteobacteria bacterium]|nr:thioredoxin family protein [Pseudomonadota bacterium]